ncbi:Fip1 motif-domain-containing protein [Apiospora arundinis]
MSRSTIGTLDLNWLSRPESKQSNHTTTSDTKLVFTKRTLRHLPKPIHTSQHPSYQPDKMDIDDDDDFYAPDEPETTQATTQPVAGTNAPAEDQQAHDEDLEEGEEEDEGADMDEDDDSDIDIITERKDGTKAPPPPSARYSDIRNIPQRTTSTDGASKPVLKKEDTTNKSVSGADLPAVATSKIDVNAIPIHKATGKPITQVNIDEDLPENDKPWRKPGTDLSDYFNYGFDEFTWAMYAAKQENVRGEYNQDMIAANNKKMMEDMQMMMMGGMPVGGGQSMPAMPGMDGSGMTPDMQQMMQQMMASGMDPSQMDPAAMSAMFSGMQPGGGGGNAGGGGQGQGQNFGGQGQGFDGNQNQNFGGYNQGMGGGRGGGGGGFGRGRGGRRW